MRINDYRIILVNMSLMRVPNMRGLETSKKKVPQIKMKLENTGMNDTKRVSLYRTSQGL